MQEPFFIGKIMMPVPALLKESDMKSSVKTGRHLRQVLLLSCATCLLPLSHASLLNGPLIAGVETWRCGNRIVTVSNQASANVRRLEGCLPQYGSTAFPAAPASNRAAHSGSASR